MSCCTKAAIACIFCRGSVFEAVNTVTCCLISAEASTREPTRVEYHFPIVSQSAKPFRTGPPDVKNETIMRPATPSKGGMSVSLLISVTLFTVHCHELLPATVALTSGWFSQETLYSQPGGSSRV